MPRIARELSDAAVRRMKWTTTKSGPNAGKPRQLLHPVGGVSGLHLYCRAPAPGADTAGRSWVLRVQVGTKRRDIGLGPYPEVTLSEARQRAREAKAKIRQGIDPAAERRAFKSALIAAQAQDVTFAEVAQRFYEKKARELKTATQATRLRSRLDTYAIPALGHLLVRDIDRANIIECLRPVWETKTETAQRVRIYVERILDIAHAEGLRTGENPARWKGNLELSLPKARDHYPGSAPEGPALRGDAHVLGQPESARHAQQQSPAIHYPDRIAQRRGPQGNVGRGRPAGACMDGARNTNEGRPRAQSTAVSGSASAADIATEPGGPPVYQRARQSTVRRVPVEGSKAAGP